MIKSLIYIFAVFYCSIMFSQQKVDTYETSLDNISTIVLTLRDANIIKTSSASNSILVETELFVRGWCVGWRERKKNTPFLINSYKNQDTLFIESPKHKGGSYGLSFGASEDIKTYIEIPKEKEVIIKEAQDIETFGDFKKLIVEDVDKLELNDINKKFIKQLTCMSVKIKIDGNRLNSNYGYNGSGTAVYKLDAKKIIFNNFQFH